MKWYRRHWYSFNLIFLLIALLWAITFSHSRLQLILLLNFCVILIHQFEEFCFPGGGPAVSNIALAQHPVHPDRYPLNENNNMVINVCVGDIFYLLPVFFPQIGWLGLAPTLFGFMQLYVHGVTENRKLGTYYNGGLASVILGHVPLGIWYLLTAYHTGMLTIINILLAVIYIIFVAKVLMQWLGFKVLGNQNSPYPFDQTEMHRFHIDEKLAKKHEHD